MSVGTVIRGAVRTVSGARGGMGGLPPGLRVDCRVYLTVIRESTLTATIDHPKGRMRTAYTAKIVRKQTKMGENDDFGPKSRFLQNLQTSREATCQ